MKKTGRNYFLWKKKIGDIHIAGERETLCGRPMLGNNYATQNEPFVTCIKCTEEHMKLYPEEYNFNK